jgi:signal transduction histidine kinase
LGWLHILKQDGVDTETKQRALEIIEHNALAQAQLIEDLLDVSRVITGKLRLNLTPVDLDESIEKAIEVVRPTQIHAIRWNGDNRNRSGRRQYKRGRPRYRTGH